MFWHGQQLGERGQLLPASGQMAVIKYASADEVDEVAVLGWAKEALAVAAGNRP